MEGTSQVHGTPNQVEQQLLNASGRETELITLITRIATCLQNGNVIEAGEISKKFLSSWRSDFDNQWNNFEQQIVAKAMKPRRD